MWFLKRLSNLFTLRLALKYLLPKRKSLSTALISLLSVFVISLVVWLLLVFLSVTGGIEKNWQKKLTALHAPVRLTPTDAYFSSYYYQIDKYAAKSHYCLKTIGEKAETPATDPYLSSVDPELPSELTCPHDKVDIVKETYKILSTIPSIAYQDYELSGALLKLSLDHRDSHGEFLSQMSYLLSMPDKNPALSSLLISPSPKDLDHLFYQLQKKGQDTKACKEFFQNIKIEKVKTPAAWTLNLDLLDQTKKFYAFASFEIGHIRSLVLLSEQTPNQPISNYTPGVLLFDKGWVFQSENSQKIPLSSDTLVTLDAPLLLDASIDSDSLKTPSQEVFLTVDGLLQKQRVFGKTSYQKLFLEKGQIRNTPSSPYWAAFDGKRVVLPSFQKATPILLPKSLRDCGALLADTGYLSYTTAGVFSNTEQRIPIKIAGFYDPGFLPVGNRFVIVPSSVTRAIHGSIATYSPDHTPTNGIFVWFDDLNKASSIKNQIQKKLQETGLLSYWKVETFQEYEFSKDLMQQFQSDRILFTLVGLIILIVACCNIVSLLILLVNDKKREIAVLQAIGATKRQIATLFGFCGFIMGLFSCLLGTFAAFITLHNIQHVAHLLSYLQGHTAFNPAFFGEALPGSLSPEAFLFVLIATPLLSLIAGLIPAIKAIKLSPSSLLRS